MMTKDYEGERTVAKEETVKDILDSISHYQAETIAQLVMITDALVDGSRPEADAEDNAIRNTPTILEELRIRRDNSEAILEMVIRIKAYLW